MEEEETTENLQSQAASSSDIRREWLGPDGQPPLRRRVFVKGPKKRAPEEEQQQEADDVEEVPESKRVRQVMGLRVNEEENVVLALHECEDITAQLDHEVDNKRVKSRIGALKHDPELCSVLMMMALNSSEEELGLKAKAIAAEYAKKPVSEFEGVYDYYTGKLLDAAAVKQGRVNEVNQLAEFDGMREFHRSRRGLLKIVRAGWIDKQSGAIVRSRLIAKEYNYEVRDDVYAGTPLQVIIRIILSCAATKGSAATAVKLRQLALYDVSVAFMHARAQKQILLIPPPDLRKKDWFWELLIAMNGTREGSTLWAGEIERVCLTNGFVKVEVTPCLNYNKSHDIDLSYHGDDFIADGEPEDLDWLDQVFHKAFKLSRVLRVGPNALSEGCLLNRTIRWDERGFQLEENEKHVKDLLKILNLEDCKGSDVPGSKTIGDTCSEREDFLGHEESKVFQSGAGISLYLAPGRKDTQYSVSRILNCSV